MQSLETDARIVESAEKATWQTVAWCPQRTFSRCPVVVLQSRTVQSTNPDASFSESGEKAIDRILFV